MSNTNTGGPAFPVADPFAVKCPPTDAEALRLQQGMTLRDYFAAKALHGELASQSSDGYEWRDHEKLARHCYNIADAMLEARSE